MNGFYDTTGDDPNTRIRALCAKAAAEYRRKLELAAASLRAFAQTIVKTQDVKFSMRNAADVLGLRRAY